MFDYGVEAPGGRGTKIYLKSIPIVIFGSHKWFSSLYCPKEIFRKFVCSIWGDLKFVENGVKRQVCFSAKIFLNPCIQVVTRSFMKICFIPSNNNNKTHYAGIAKICIWRTSYSKRWILFNNADANTVTSEKSPLPVFASGSAFCKMRQREVRKLTALEVHFKSPELGILIGCSSFHLQSTTALTAPA